MRLSVVLSKAADVEAFVAMMEAAGVTVERVPGLPRFLTVHADETAFASFDQTDVVSFSPADEPWFQPSRSIEIPRSWRAPWHLLRHTQRDAPWNKGGLTFPLAYDFECDRKGRGVDVYVFDSGLLTTHEEFVGLDAYLIYDKRGFPPVFDDDYERHHGTAVTSVAVGRKNGFAPAARLFSSIVFSNEEPTASLDAIIRSFAAAIINHAASSNPGVVNMSLGALDVVERKRDFYAEIIGEALDAGLIIVAGAGNNKAHIEHPYDVLPAGSNGVICVAGTAWNDGPYVLSNFGLTTDILAAGQHILVADGADAQAYKVESGTSLSTPCVTGIVACMLEGYRKPRDRAEVAAVGRYLYEQATFGRYRRDPAQEPQTDGIAYLDPGPIAKAPPIRGLLRRDQATEGSEPRTSGYLARQSMAPALFGGRSDLTTFRWPRSSPAFIAATDVGKNIVIPLGSIGGEIESFVRIAGDRFHGVGDGVEFVRHPGTELVDVHLAGQLSFLPDYDHHLRRTQWRATLTDGREFDVFLCWYVREYPRVMHYGSRNLLARIGRPISSEFPDRGALLTDFPPFAAAVPKPSPLAFSPFRGAHQHCFLARLATANSGDDPWNFENPDLVGAFDSRPNRTVSNALVEGTLPPGVCVAIPEPVVLIDHNRARGFDWNVTLPPYTPVEPEDRQFSYRPPTGVSIVKREALVFAECLPALIGAPKLAGLYPVTLRWTNDLGQTLDHRVTIEVLEP